MSSLTRGRDIARQAWYAVFRHTRGNPETRFTETYLYRCTLSTLPADGTLALAMASAGLINLAKSDTCCAFRSPAVARGYAGRAVLVVDSKLNGVMEYRSFGLLCLLRITSRRTRDWSAWMG